MPLLKPVRPPAPLPRPVPPIEPATRRRFLELSAGATVAAWLAPLLQADPGARTPSGGRLVATLPFVGEGTFPLETTIGAGLGRRRALDLSTLSAGTPVVPQERFFIRTGAPDRLPPASSWKVRVHGLVEAPVEITAEELQHEAAPMGAHLLECAGNSRNAHFGLISAARWTGLPLARVLERVRPAPRATQVLVSGFDEHTVADPGSVPGASWIFGLRQIRESGAFVATGMNGVPLSPDHGDPLRLVVPGWYGCTAIKWLNEIALVDDQAPATDQMREYAGRTHQDQVGLREALAKDFQPATIDPAALPVRVEKLDAGRGTISYRIVGILWGGPIAPRDLRIRLDPGPGFTRVEQIGTSAGRAWTLWSHTFRSPAPGRYRIELAIKDPGTRTRRLDLGYYVREIDIPAV